MEGVECKTIYNERSCELDDNSIIPAGYNLLETTYCTLEMSKTIFFLMVQIVKHMDRVLIFQNL